MGRRKGEGEEGARKRLVYLALLTIVIVPCEPPLTIRPLHGSEGEAQQTVQPVPQKSVGAARAGVDARSIRLFIVVIMNAQPVHIYN